MRYIINFQPKNHIDARPIDCGDLVPLRYEQDELHNLPNIGDHVNFQRFSLDAYGEEVYTDIFGVVVDRLFSYYTSANNESSCYVNIVVLKKDDPDGYIHSRLLKE
ncbi:hypothetical protein HJ167_18395 [Vibrio parahaemolyticus]|nr:hypothetical protein [Vibrio parahaemolyticus]